MLYISRRHEGIHEGVVVCFAFLQLIIMRDIHLDLLSNEWGPCNEEMFNIWCCRSRHGLSKVRHYYAQRWWGPVEGKGLGALAFRLPLAPERDATAHNSKTAHFKVWFRF